MNILEKDYIKTNYKYIDITLIYGGLIYAKNY